MLGTSILSALLLAATMESEILVTVSSISAQAAFLLSWVKEGPEKWAQVHIIHISNLTSGTELTKDKEFMLAAGRTDR